MTSLEKNSKQTYHVILTNTEKNLKLTRFCSIYFPMEYNWAHTGPRPNNIFL